MSAALTQWLRGAVLLGVAAAVVDPGCSTREPAPVRLVVGASVAASEADALERAVRDAGLEVVRDAGPDAIQVATGTPREIVDTARASTLALAVRPTPRPHIVRLGAPAAPVAGLVLVLQVSVADVPAEQDDLVVRVREVLAGRIVGSAPVPVAPAPSSDESRVEVPLMPVTDGPWALCVSVEPEVARAGERGDCERLNLVVAPSAVKVHVLGARPSWAARFVRLALTRADSIAVSSASRIARGITVQQTPSVQSRASDGHDVTIVAGLDALTSADVSGLVRRVRDEGHSVVLLADGPLPADRLGALWPQQAGPVRTRATPARLSMGAHGMAAREWLAPGAMATAATPLAYLAASPAVPVVWGRALGAGHVVLMAALDTWRWRGDDDGAHDAAWQALVWSLAALRRQEGLHVWRVSNGFDDEVHLAQAAGVDQGDTPHWTAQWAAHAGNGGVERGGPQQVRATMVRTETGWRGVVTVPAGTTPVDVTPQASDASASTDGRLRVANAAPAPVGWADVERVVSANGGDVVSGEALASALRSAAAHRDVAGPRWFATRQWWYAACIIAALGCEWWLRRLARRR